ncbi:MAG: cysteine-rich CWC family protein [Saprospiraceae bacterium]|nr:cysteine-rich CWC family protein [Saprospiraceae bacterium]
MGSDEIQQLTAHCPRCGADMVCSAGKGQRCACADVQLSELTLTFLQKTSYSCLCNACLRQYEAWVGEAAKNVGTANGDGLVEGIHYYIEDGKWVFTPVYHIERGHCCQSGCRHCPYGYDSKQQL